MQRSSALLLGAGALLGAAAGVLVVHQPGWADVARRMLGGVLWLVAVRFVLDLRRSAADRA